ncbi:uncharacterized protein LOC101058308 [Pan troglodytes]|uniref:Uncharacterized protein n=1 Tax=Pan troglodytes TaxID=9598 RepID=G2HJI8_PANTR|nr:uncharacterized protein LOC101058308 [Pan troglodytes]BAK63896.1 hypothetical protein [Pan troglodytes]
MREAMPLFLSPDSRRKPSPTAQSHLCMAGSPPHSHPLDQGPRAQAPCIALSWHPPTIPFLDMPLSPAESPCVLQVSPAQHLLGRILIPCSSSSSPRVTARLEEAAEGVKPPHTGLRKHSVDIKEWCSEGAEAVAWHCHCHSFTNPKPQEQGAPGGRDRTRLLSPVALLPSHLPGDQAPDQGQPPNAQSPQVLSGFWSPTQPVWGCFKQSFLHFPDCSETT